MVNIHLRAEKSFWSTLCALFGGLLNRRKELNLIYTTFTKKARRKEES